MVVQADIVSRGEGKTPKPKKDNKKGGVKIGFQTVEASEETKVRAITASVTDGGDRGEHNFLNDYIVGCCFLW